MTRSPVLTCIFLATLARGAATDIVFQVADTKGAPVADAVVSLVRLDAPAQGAPPAAPLEIVQKGKEFIPFVTPVAVGTTVNFSNQDEVEHQVYSLSNAKKFELPLYKPGKANSVVFDRPGVVSIGCNIHDWMLAYIVVLESPWFAKTAADGAALVAGVPPGRYRAEVWQSRLAKIETRELTVTGGGSAPLAFTLTLKPDRRIRRTPDAAGGGYK